MLHEFCPLDFPEFLISAEHGTGLEDLRNAIYEALDVVRVYTKLPTHKEPDYRSPLYGPARRNAAGRGRC